MNHKRIPALRMLVTSSVLFAVTPAVYAVPPGCPPSQCRPVQPRPGDGGGGGRPDRPSDRPNNPGGGGGQRPPDRPQQPDRPPQRPDQPQRPPGGGGFPGNPGGGGGQRPPDRPQQPDRPPQRPDQPQRPPGGGGGGFPGNPGGGGQRPPDRPQQPDRPPQRPDQPQRPPGGGGGFPGNPGGGGQRPPDRPQQPDRPPQRPDQPQRPPGGGGGFPGNPGGGGQRPPDRPNNPPDHRPDQPQRPPGGGGFPGQPNRPPGGGMGPGGGDHRPDQPNRPGNPGGGGFPGQPNRPGQPGGHHMDRDRREGRGDMDRQRQIEDRRRWVTDERNRRPDRPQVWDRMRQDRDRWVRDSRPVVIVRDPRIHDHDRWGDRYNRWYDECRRPTPIYISNPYPVYYPWPTASDTWTLMEVERTAINIEALTRNVYDVAVPYLANDPNMEYVGRLPRVLAQLDDAALNFAQAVYNGYDFSDSLDDLFYLDASVSLAETTLYGWRDAYTVDSQMREIRYYVDQLMWIYRTNY